jgi:hypothetical protein
LTTLHAYPLPISTPVSVPTQGQIKVPVWFQQENVLTQLLRKKLEPEAEEWMATGLAAYQQQRLHDAAAPEPGETDEEDRQKLWVAAGDLARELAENMPWGANFTLAERAAEGGVAAVDTGLKRDLAAEEDDSDEEDGGDDDDDEVMEDAVKVGDQVKMDVNGDVKEVVVKPPVMALEDVMRFVSTGVLLRRRPGPGGITMRG